MENYYYDSASSGDVAWVGIKRGRKPSEGKLGVAVMEKRYRCDDNSEREHPHWKHVAVYASLAGTKRGYEEPEDEFEIDLMDKRYKGNYWADPACASSVQIYGGRKAKHATQINQAYRAMKETDAWLASVAARQARQLD